MFYRAISTLSAKLLKIMNKFTYLSSNISSTESDVNICIGTTYTDCHWEFVDHMEILSLFGGVSITVWLHHLDSDKIFGEKARWELHKISTCSFEKSLKQNPTKPPLYSHLPPISQTIQDEQDIVVLMEQ